MFLRSNRLFFFSWAFFVGWSGLAVSQDPNAPGPQETVIRRTGGERSGAEQPDQAIVEQAIIEQTNAFREKQDRSPVDVNKTALAESAREFARYMAETGRYGHHADGRTPAERAAAAGYEYCIVRENIAYAFRSGGFSTEQLADRFVSGWKDSPGHRRNMLARHVTETAVAISKSEEGTYFAVQLFARPESEAVSFKVDNQSDLNVTYRIDEREYSLRPRVVMSHQGCQPQTIKFLPLDSDEDAADPPTPVEKIRVTGGEYLTVSSAESGYRVAVQPGGVEKGE